MQGTLSLVFDYLPTDLEMMINARDPGKEPYVALPSGDTKVPPTSILPFASPRPSCQPRLRGS